MTVAGTQERIVREVARWDGVQTGPHRFGGTEFKLGRREIGHVHGDYQADIAFTLEVRNRLVSEGRAEPHHILPRSGWVTFRFRQEKDVQSAVELFRLSYELAAGRLRQTDVGAVTSTRSI